MAQPIITKRCSLCAEVKPVCEFYRCREMKSGFSSACKPCSKDRDKVYAVNAKAQRMNPQPCACGCGQVSVSGLKWIEGHRRNQDQDAKICKKCKQRLPMNEFYLLVRRPIKGVIRHVAASLCRPCSLARSRAYAHSTPERKQKARDACHKWRMRKFPSLYGITEERYNQMTDAQGGNCAICRRPPGDRRLTVDHCHTSGKVRALLCSPCNLLLGQMERDIDLIPEMLLYIERHK